MSHELPEHDVPTIRQGGASPMPEATDFETTLTQVEELLKQSDHKAANELCETLLADHEHEPPDCYDVHLRFGKLLIKCENHERAIEQFEAAIFVKSDLLEAYIHLGFAQFECHYYKAAISAYEQALAIIQQGDDPDPDSDALQYIHFGWGNALVREGFYEEALEHFQLATSRPNRFRTYALQNRAECLHLQGKYRETWETWQDVVDAYVKTPEEQRDANYFHYFGTLLYEMFGDPQAEDLLRKGLTKDPNHSKIHRTLVNLYRERAEDDINNRAAYHWSALRHFEKAKSELEVHAEDDPHLYLQLGNLCLSMEAYEDAESYLSKLSTAERSGQDAARLHTALGVVCARRENWKEARRHFELANGRNPVDLKVRSNLAEVVFKAGDLQRAEADYRDILAVAPGHIESHVGLGELYKSLGDSNADEDNYSEALHHLSRALEIASGRQGSKRLRRREIAEIHYSMGYTRAKLYEVSARTRRYTVLRQAARDFKSALDDHPQNYKAERALQKVRDELKQGSAQRAAERFGPVLLVTLALFVFIVVQGAFLFAKPKISLGVSDYILLTFGSLLFIVAGLSLPQLLKLKVGIVELEKATVEQVGTQITLVEK